MNQLQTLNWIDQLYNLILLGPLGVGKTHLAKGLGIQAIEQGYRAMFVSIGELVYLLKAEEISRKSQIRLKRVRDAHLVDTRRLDVHGHVFARSEPVFPPDH